MGQVSNAASVKISDACSIALSEDCTVFELLDPKWHIACAYLYRYLTSANYYHHLFPTCKKKILTIGKPKNQKNYIY